MRNAALKEGKRLSPVIPKAGPPPVDLKVRCPADLAKALDMVVEVENAKRAEGEKLSRNDVVVHFCRSAFETWQKERKSEK